MKTSEPDQKESWRLREKSRAGKKQGVNLRLRKVFEPSILTQKRETLVNNCTHHFLWGERHIKLLLLQQSYQVQNKSISENSLGQS